MVNEQEKKAVVKQHHTVRIDNRERMSISGVEDVHSFDEYSVVVATNSGVIGVVGEDLHISKLNTEDGQLIISGRINGFTYDDPIEENHGDSILKRLFR